MHLGRRRGAQHERCKAGATPHDDDDDDDDDDAAVGTGKGQVSDGTNRQ